MLSDLRFSFRQLLKSPGFTLVAVLTLALGIGANTATFSLINALLLNPLPFEDSDRIVQITFAQDQIPDANYPSNGGAFLDFESAATQFESLSISKGASLNLTGIEQPKRLNGMEVSHNFLETFRIEPAFGSDFTPENDSANGENRVVLISHSLWENEFGSNYAAVGKVVTLDYQPYTIIGILPPNWFIDIDPDFLVPAAIRAYDWKQKRDYTYPCGIFGRLKPDATPESAAIELQTIKESLNASYPDLFKDRYPVVETFKNALFGDSTPIAMIMLVVVGMVLLVACANVANLLLAKTSARQGEFALRSAVGASNWQIIRQLLCESSLLALLGGQIGLLIAILALKPLAILGGIAELNIPFDIDSRVLLFTLGISLLTGIFFGSFPAFAALRNGAATGLRDSSRSATSARGNKIQSTLVVFEVALTVILLASIGLLLKSFTQAIATDPGFQKENIVTFEIDRSSQLSPTPEDRTRFSTTVIEQIKTIPGVSEAAMISTTPMNGTNFFGAPFWPIDQPDKAHTYLTGFDSINGNAFSVLGIPLLAGRYFDERDQQPDSPKVVIINQQVLLDQFPDEDPIGKAVNHDGEVWTVVGVVGSINRFSLDSGAQPMVYKPMIHWPWSTGYVVKTQLQPEKLIKEIQAAVLAVDPQQPVDRIRTLEQAVSESVGPRTQVLSLIAIFGALAAILAAIGIYALMTYLVEQRNREIGIRLAIGAQPNEVVSMIFRQGIFLTLIGVGIGIVGVILLGRYLALILYRVEHFDPIVLVSVTILTIAITALSCWRPANTASKIHPTTILRA